MRITFEDGSAVEIRKCDDQVIISMSARTGTGLTVQSVCLNQKQYSDLISDVQFDKLSSAQKESSAGENL